MISQSLSKSPTFLLLGSLRSLINASSVSSFTAAAEVLISGHITCPAKTWREVQDSVKTSEQSSAAGAAHVEGYHPKAKTSDAFVGGPDALVRRPESSALKSSVAIHRWDPLNPATTVSVQFKPVISVNPKSLEPRRIRLIVRNTIMRLGTVRHRQGKNRGIPVSNLHGRSQVSARMTDRGGYRATKVSSAGTRSENESTRQLQPAGAWIFSGMAPHISVQHPSEHDAQEHSSPNGYHKLWKTRLCDLFYVVGLTHTERLDRNWFVVVNTLSNISEISI